MDEKEILESQPTEETEESQEFSLDDIIKEYSN